MNVFVNDATSPTLEVGRLEGDAIKGGLRLQGPATFANMVITPDAVDGLSPEPARDPLDGDRGLVRNWRLSKFSALPKGKDAMYNEMPGASQEWKTISTERNGLVNLSREYGRPLPEPNRAVAWLKRGNFLTRDVRWRMAPLRCLWKRAIMRSRWQSRTTSSDGD